jgi:hypothetical protein
MPKVSFLTQSPGLLAGPPVPFDSPAVGELLSCLESIDRNGRFGPKVARLFRPCCKMRVEWGR